MTFVKSISLLAVCLSGIASGTSLRASDVEDLSSLEVQMPLFHTWTETHSKEYTTEEEKMERLKVWMANNGTSSIELPTWIFSKFHRRSIHFSRFQWHLAEDIA
jgi:hypothetical protein